VALILELFSCRTSCSCEVV